MDERVYSIHQKKKEMDSVTKYGESVNRFLHGSEDNIKSRCLLTEDYNNVKLVRGPWCMPKQ